MHFCFTVAIRTVALAQHSLPTIAVEQEMNLQISFSFFLTICHSEFIVMINS